jgi:hypothetical protein
MEKFLTRCAGLPWTLMNMCHGGCLLSKTIAKISLSLYAFLLPVVGQAYLHRTAT